MCKKDLDRAPNIPEMQKEVLEFWKENKTFEKSLVKERSRLLNSSAEERNAIL